VHNYIAIALLSLATCASSAQAGDWPQILGPNRNGHATDETLLDEWPSGGPEKLWSLQIGTGFAGPAIRDGVVYLFHRQASSELVWAVDLQTGKKLWTKSYRANYVPTVNPDDGPRCVPLVTETSVIVFGAAGALRSLDRKSGDRQWEVDLAERFSAPNGYFGAGSTPIAVNDRILVNIGGRNRTAIVSLDSANGKILWTAFDDQASYSSPITTTINEKRYGIFVTRLNCIAIDPFVGDVHYQFEFGRSGPTVNAAMPLVHNNELFVSAAYGVGAKLVQLKPKSYKTIWENDDSLTCQYNTPVLVDGYLYGIHGREDYGNTELRCVDWKTGRVQWSERNFDPAHIIVADGKLILTRLDGTAILAKPSSDKFEKISSFRATTDITRAIPALSQGKLLVRETGPRGGPVHCYSTGSPDSEP